MRNTLRIILSCLAGLFLSAVFAACSASDIAGISLADNGDGSTQIGDGGTYDPTSNSTDYAPCTRDDSGNCIENTDNTGAVDISTEQIDFGMSEIGAVQCETITIPGGLSYAAEIDDVGDSDEFEFMTGTDTYSADRVEGSDSVSVCYMRKSTGTHTGQFKLVLNASSTSSSIYAYVIVLKGQTLDPFFTITAPTDGQIVDEQDGFNEGRDDDEGDYYLTGSGSVNSNLINILHDGINTPVIIESAGVKYKATIDSSYNFSTRIAVPQATGIYNVSFSVETTIGSELTKTLSVVVATTPDFKILVKDTSGADVSSAVPSDIQELVVGFQVKNLDLSGSSQTDMPVSLSQILWNGTDLGKDINIWYASGESWCNSGSTLPATDTTTDYTGFDGTTTYCIPLSAISQVQSGENTVTATATNALGTAIQTFTLILDYNKPTITITEPKEDQLFPATQTTYTISGTVSNYAPLDATATAPTVQGTNTGSYCRVADSVTEDSACPTSSVTLWINGNTGSHPIYIYPQLPADYDGLSRDDINKKIIATTPERCRNFTTDATTGEITTTSDTECNMPSGTFSLHLTLPDTTLAAPLNLYANIIEMHAESLSGDHSHRTIAIRDFFTGETNPQTFSTTSTGSGGKFKLAMTGDLHDGALGKLDTTTGLVTRAPIMLNLSEGTIKDTAIRYVLQKYLNDNFKFSDVANGWMNWPRDDNGNIDIEADFQRQYAADENGANYGDFWTDLDLDHQKEFIQQALHSNSMAEKYWSIVRYEGLGAYRGWWSSGDAYLYTFNRDGDPEANYNVSRDTCGQVITTSFAALGDLRYVYEHMNVDVNAMPYSIPEWPDIAADNIDFNDFVSGRWIVQSVELKEGVGNSGSIDVDACIVPTNADVDNCDDDIPYKDDLLPAMWGHFTSYNLVEGGLLGAIDDPTMPLIWSIGKMRFKLADVIKFTKVKDANGNWTNKVKLDDDLDTNGDGELSDSEVAKSKITMSTNPDNASSMYDDMSKNSIQIYPFARCADYYQELLDNGTYNDSGWHDLPFGCDQKDANYNKPFLLEVNSEKGKSLYNTFFSSGESYYVLNVVWEGVMETFAKQIRCTDDEAINPLLNSDAFPYPVWVQSESKIDTTFEVVANNGELSLKQAADVTSDDQELFETSLNITQADINTNYELDPTSASAITIRLPFQVTLKDVMNPNLMITPRLLTGDSYTTANTSGHLMRTSAASNLSTAYPPTATAPENDVFAGLSVNAEELFNSFTYLLYKKGPFSFLDYLGVDDLEVNNNYSIGVDKVVFARMGICDNLGGVLDTNLPPGILFSNISSQFDSEALHMDIELNKNYPPTLALSPIDGLTTIDPKHASNVEISFTNVEISVKELNSATAANHYTIGDEVVRLRVDGVISMKVVYRDDAHEFDIYLDPYANQNIHFSVVSGKGGTSYDDVNVIYNLATEIVPTAFDKAAQAFNETVDEDGNTATPSFSLKFSADDDGNVNLSSLVNMQFTSNAADFTNGSCDGATIPYYSSTLNISPGTVKQSIGTILASGSGIKILGSTGTKSESTSDSGSSSTHKFAGISTAPIKASPITSLIGTCTEDGKNIFLYDPIKGALCDYGIEDIDFKPQIEIDNDNGYIHLSSDIAIKIYDWLIEENR